MVRRSKLEMKLDILKAIQGHAWKKSEYPVSQLMHDSNVSYMPLRKLLVELEKAGLVNNSTKGTLRTFQHFYFLTAKGRDALRHYEELSNLIDEKPISALED